ncbi:hypothetical protein FOZ63_026886 [Perkinsus olseni]|uniref:Uncharacterized protein n=1 Tax=Perkinsus olseni TaxID=32597 RepID=A0A7J6R0I7_PEROL|nr:hypothetical protein FOZ63_026886 [Perkinsus olseni]KAF4722234.1 hypothetical protein FOZ62_028982 [Perkinsus olseni]
MAVLLIAYLSISYLVTGSTHVDYGNFVYETKGRHGIKLVLNTTHDGYGLFHIECGRRRYHGDWFELSMVNSDPYDVVLNEFPDEEATLHRHWLYYARATCPKLKFQKSDFLEFLVDGEGDVRTEVEGKEVALKRQWLPLIPGRYWSDESVSVYKQQFDVHPDGYVYVKLGCKGGDTGANRRYRLKRREESNLFELTAIRGRYTVEGLLESFKEACPGLWSPYDNHYGEQLKNIGFANYDSVFAMGSYDRDRLYRRSL